METFEKAFKLATEYLKTLNGGFYVISLHCEANGTWHVRYAYNQQNPSECFLRIREFCLNEHPL